MKITIITTSTISFDTPVLHSFAKFAAIFVALLIWLNSGWAETQERKKFDHLAQTGFELTPVHRLADCADCHLHSIFKGTPRVCRGCHGSQGIASASRKGARHIRSTDNCELCHMDFTANSWAPVRRVDHLEVRGSCFSCHNGVVASGKDPNHIPSSNRCDDCHRTRSWQISRFDHNTLPASGAGICYTCHNGFFAEGKHNRHIPSSNQCDDCHLVNTWVVARFDHGVLPASGAGQCTQCHGPGGFATITKPQAANHIRNSGINPSNICDACHRSTATWTLVRTDHSQLGPDGIANAAGTGANCVACHLQDRPTLPIHPGGPSCSQAGCHQSTNDWCITFFGNLGIHLPGLCGF